jgi:hypothetical protein
MALFDQRGSDRLDEAFALDFKLSPRKQAFISTAL